MEQNINDLFIQALKQKEVTRARVVFTKENDNNIYITAPYTISIVNYLIEDYSKQKFNYQKTLIGTTKFDNNPKFDNNFKIECNTSEQQTEILLAL